MRLPSLNEETIRVRTPAVQATAASRSTHTGSSVGSTSGLPRQSTPTLPVPETSVLNRPPAPTAATPPLVTPQEPRQTRCSPAAVTAILPRPDKEPFAPRGKDR